MTYREIFRKTEEHRCDIPPYREVSYSDVSQKLIIQCEECSAYWLAASQEYGEGWTYITERRANRIMRKYASTT